MIAPTDHGGQAAPGLGASGQECSLSRTRSDPASPDSIPGWEGAGDLAKLQLSLLGFHVNDGMLEMSTSALTLALVVWALDIREKCAKQNGWEYDKPMFKHLQFMTATARSQLNQCCEWRQNTNGNYVWRITSMPWKRRTEDDRTQGDHTQGDRTRGPSSVDSQAAMKNLKIFGRYLFSDENIMYILFILGRALCWSKHPTPPLPIMPSQVKHKGPRRQPAEFEAKRIRHELETSSGC